MPPEGQTALVEAREIDGVVVVRFTRRTVLDPQAIELIGERMLALVRDEGRKKLVVNFAQVESLPSSMLGKFVSLHQAIVDAGGRLVFAGVDPFLLQIFRICNMPPSIAVLSDEAAAVRALNEAN